jgi:hypothetical protein
MVVIVEGRETANRASSWCESQLGLRYKKWDYRYIFATNTEQALYGPSRYAFSFTNAADATWFALTFNYSARTSTVCAGWLGNLVPSRKQSTMNSTDPRPHKIQMPLAEALDHRNWLFDTFGMPDQKWDWRMIYILDRPIIIVEFQSSEDFAWAVLHTGACA